MTTQLATLRERVDSAMNASPYLVNRRLQIETHEGRVVLQGAVDSYFQKQMAQETLRRVDGVMTIENQLEVTWPADRG